MSKVKKKARLKRRREKREEESPHYTGRLTVSAGGFGFVAVTDLEQDIFVPPKFLGSAMDGDTVEVALLPPRPQDRFTGKGPAGKIVAIPERGRNIVVGELIAGKKVRPLNKRLTDDIRISGGVFGAKRGDWVEVELNHKKQINSEGQRGTIKETIGRAGTIENDLMAVIKEYDLPEPYTEEQDKAALNIVPEEIHREDFTELFCVTIDPHDAKDFDDAISIRETDNENEIEMGVHIADVAAWIQPGSEWDRGARERGFTSYLPGKTLPMLPKGLTAQISLTEQDVCPAHSVIFNVNRNTGKILSAKRTHSQIKVTKRLSFDQVQEFIESGKLEGAPDDSFVEKLQVLVSLSRKMRAYRQEHEEFLEMSTVEIRVLCDDKHQEILGLERRFQREADQLVEECMLAANSAVAVEMIEKTLPGVFRVHPEPDPTKLEEFTAFIIKTFEFFPGDLSNRTACNDFLANLADDHTKPVILSAFLRSLPRAFYQEEAALHFGLGKFRYAHFTSPIRRYPDLLVHQQLWAHEKNRRFYSKKDLQQFSEACTKKEERNDEAYYAANDRLKLHYLASITEEGSQNFYEALITKITSSGLLIDINELGLYGFVPIENLPGSFRYSKEASKLQARAGHKDYECGDFIYVQLESIDFIRGSALFKPVR